MVAASGLGRCRRQAAWHEANDRRCSSQTRSDYASHVGHRRRIRVRQSGRRGDRGVRSARRRAGTGGARPRRTPGTVKSVTIPVAPEQKTVRVTPCCELGRPLSRTSQATGRPRTEARSGNVFASPTNAIDACRHCGTGAPPRLGHAHPSSALRRSDPHLTKLAPLSPRGKGADNPHPVSERDWKAVLRSSRSQR